MAHWVYLGCWEDRREAADRATGKETARTRSLNSHTREPVTEPDARRSGRVRTTARAARLCLCAPVCRVRIVMPSACVRIIMPSACTYLRGVASCVETCSNWAAQTTRLSPRGAYPSRPRSREGPTSRGREYTVFHCTEQPTEHGHTVSDSARDIQQINDS